MVAGPMIGPATLPYTVVLLVNPYSLGQFGQNCPFWPPDPTRTDRLAVRTPAVHLLYTVESWSIRVVPSILLGTVGYSSW